MRPCVRGGRPCCYHQGAADVLAALERFVTDAIGRYDVAMAEVVDRQTDPRLRDFGHGVARGMREANEVVALWAVQAGANR